MQAWEAGKCELIILGEFVVMVDIEVGPVNIFHSPVFSRMEFA